MGMGRGFFYPDILLEMTTLRDVAFTIDTGPVRPTVSTTGGLVSTTGSSFLRDDTDLILPCK